MSSPDSDQLLAMLRNTLVSLSSRDRPDLSARCLSVLLTCCLEEDAYPVKDLLTDLRVSKSAILSALGRLGGVEFVNSNVDPFDRCFKIAQKTIKGQEIFRDYVALLSSRSVNRSPTIRGRM
jgi:DNA-binding MarR family transcriptional regulator